MPTNGHILSKLHKIFVHKILKFSLIEVSLNNLSSIFCAYVI